ncbi:MAG: glycoside hydrolase family 88 protein [Clostridia bacterium]|nr:glycoside hydrolase family 88 protein [Clostridia bacterium]
MKNINTEIIKNTDRYLSVDNITPDIINSEIKFVIDKIDNNLTVFTDKFPSACSRNSVYSPTDNFDWTESFWTGMLWLAYEETGNSDYKNIAEIQIDSFKKRIEQRYNTGTHDLGFLYTLSCVAAYKLTENETAKETALKAADLLMERYIDSAGIIQAWGDLNDPSQSGRMIIDCLMNLPLLYWASEVTGDKKYKAAASSHAHRAAEHIVRDDASAFHTFYMDVKTGRPIMGKTAQGFSDKSSWARGQAWGIYGFLLSYIYTGDPEFINISQKMANYFLNRLPEDDVCYWDLIFTDGAEERDSSAAAVAACGLLELYKHLPDKEEARIYKNAALKITASLGENYTSKNVPGSNGVLLHAVYSKPSGFGVDECCIWGDYFYFEALTRIKKDWKLYW